MKNVLLPHSFEELWSAVDAHPDFCIFGGGTDLLVKMRDGSIRTSTLIGLERIAELRTVREESDHIIIGASASIASLIDNESLSVAFPVLTGALGTIGGPAIRNMATIGGNICTASPAGDSLPPLYVLDAELILKSRAGERGITIRDFIAGPGRTALQRGEILAEIRLQRRPELNLQYFEKVGQRKAHAISIASLAVCATRKDDGTVQGIRCAWGSVGPRIVESDAVHEVLNGHRLTETLLTNAAAIAQSTVSPIDDIRGSADYRRTVAGNLLFRLCE